MSNDIITAPSVTTTSATPTGALPDPRPEFAAALATARDVLSAVRPEQLADPTPCPEYDVRTLAGHILAVLQRIALVGAGGDPFGAPAFVSGVADDAWVEAFDAYAAEVDRVWRDDAVLARTCTLPWAQLPGFVTLSIYVNEITVHTWDLATATGQRPVWDQRALETAFAAMQQGLPAEGRAASFAAAKASIPVEHRNAGDPFGEAVTVPADAALIDRLVAWNGRRP